jgi:hypothetical protein
MFKFFLKWLNYQRLIFIVLGIYVCSGTAYGAPDSYIGSFIASVNGKNNFKISRVKNGSYRCEFHGFYPGVAGENIGNADCSGTVSNNLGVFKQNDWTIGALYILFKQDQALVVQVGEATDCGFNRDVNATGLFHRRTGVTPKLKSSSDLHGVHFEKDDGTLAFPGTFESATPFREERAVVFAHKQNGFIDLNGRLVIPYKFNQAHSFYEGLAAVSLDGIYDYAWDFAEGTGPVAIGKMFFWIDKSGDKITTKTWDRVIHFAEGLTSFERDKLWGVVDREGTEIMAAKYIAPVVFTEGMADFKTSFGKQGYLDKSGNEAVAPLFDRAEPFSEGLAAVQTKSLIGFIDKTGSKVIPDEFTEVYGGFQNGRCFVRQIGSPYISIIDKSGKTLKELALPFRDIVQGTNNGLVEGAAVCYSQDFDWDIFGHYRPVDQNGNPLSGFANKDVNFWKGDGLFVVNGPAASSAKKRQ